MRLASLQPEIGRLARYGIIGLGTNLSLYLLFLLLLRLAVHPVASAGICYVLGVAMSYLLNRRWTFASTNSHQRDLAKFLCAYGLGLVSTMLTLGMLLHWLAPQPAQIVNIGITAIVIYCCLRLLRFGSKRSGHAH